MFRHVRSAFLIGLLAAGSLVLAACADDDAADGNGATNGGTGGTATEAAGGGGEGTSIAVSLTEWQVSPASSSTSAGDVVFEVSNDGTTPHDLTVLRTDMPADGLPVEAGQVVTGDDVEVVDQTEDFAAGEGGELEVELESGSYVLICNVAGHYDLGMHTAFTVN